ncbi:hypothetical protein [Leptospira santarosai]|uniref:hypothetical protein n=2 Tax=Leptospira santarosai TaxID=28183 RepID=UPI000380738A|nr:hypothetical protein [Leptospira santarosai]
MENLKNYKINYFKEAYYKEIERNEMLSNGFNYPASIIPVLIGVIIAFLIDTMPINVSCNNISTIIFLAFLGLGSLFLIAGIYYLYKFQTHFEYYYLQNSDLIRDYLDGLESHYSNLKPIKREKKVIEDMETYLLEEFIKCSNKNAENNDTKSYYLLLTKRFIGATLSLMFLGSIPYFFIKNINGDVKRVEIVNQKLKINLVPEEINVHKEQ